MTVMWDFKILPRQDQKEQILHDTINAFHDLQRGNANQKKNYLPYQINVSVVLR